ncbi:MAG: phage major tail protein, TP901-1 family [Sphingomonadales bacterium]
MAEKGLAFLLRAPATGIAATFSATTDKATATAHGLANGDPVFFTTTGALPALVSGTLDPNTVYYAGNVTANTFSIHPTKTDGVNATNGLDLSDTGSGVHTATPLKVIAGLRSNSFTLNGESVDVSTKDSTCQWRELLPGAGQIAMSLSGSGVFQDNSNVIDLRADCIARTAKIYSVVFESGDEYFGLFQVTSVEQGGEHNGEVTYSVSLESGGSISLNINI